jgi:hypothetical protein
MDAYVQCRKLSRQQQRPPVEARKYKGEKEKVERKGKEIKEKYTLRRDNLFYLSFYLSFLLFFCPYVWLIFSSIY